MGRKLIMMAVILQARMGSTRLPGKSLLPLGGSTLVQMAMARLRLVRADAYVLATDSASASLLAPAASSSGFQLLVGSADDVLSRYCDAIRRWKPDLVMRATGDNPLVSHELAVMLADRRKMLSSDYAGYLDMPSGLGVELIDSEALLRAEREAKLPMEREHVCPYLYSHPEIFRIDRPQAPEAFRLPGARVTVDLPEDYEAMLRIYGALYDGKPIPTALVINYLSGRS